MEGIIPVIQYLWLSIDIFSLYRAVKKLKKWLQVRDELLTSDEILRVWKGLHYCFWMSDKPLVQEELAESISSFVHCFKVSKQKTFNLTELFFKYYLQSIFSRNFCFIFALFSYRWKIPMFSNLSKLEWSPRVGNGLG